MKHIRGFTDKLLSYIIDRYEDETSIKASRAGRPPACAPVGAGGPDALPLVAGHFQHQSAVAALCGEPTAAALHHVLTTVTLSRYTSSSSVCALRPF